MTPSGTPEHSRYINRHLSWLQFNRRVLEEGQDESVPLLERTKFLSIVSTNQDEFVSVRLSEMLDQVKTGSGEADFTGLTPQQLLQKVMASMEQMVSDQYDTHQRIDRLLAEQGILFTTYGALGLDQKKEMEAYFFERVFPVLTPLAVDKSRPFPLIRTKSIYIAVVLREPGVRENHLALVEVPANLPRFIEVSAQSAGAERTFILLEDLIKQYIPVIFNKYSPVSLNMFRLTRDADLVMDEEGAEDLLDEMEKVLRSRKWGTPARLEVEAGFDPYALELLKEELGMDYPVFMIDGPIDLSYYMAFSSSLSGYDHLRYPNFEPVYPREFEERDDFFDVLQARDVMVFHPYESFEAVNDFIDRSAEDPSVLAIKMTLYRVNGDSRIIQSLMRAAEAGKQVTVVVELKARFDEARNIEWAKALEKAGCHVVYGLAGLKIHAKMTMVVRREADALRRYIHVATGNYNGDTARMFTDVGLFTSNRKIGEDVSNLFNEITGFSTPGDLRLLGVSPNHLKQRLFGLINRESENAALGKPARIIAKMNALSNQELTDQLYAASQAGVKIDLIVRGICVLRPGIPGLSENITVRSIVDRFLEHSRIFYFENAGAPEVWISSADWMTRNLDRRIELMCPVLDEGLKSVVVQFLSLTLRDNVKTRMLQASGQYARVKNEQVSYRSQFLAKAWIMDRKDLSDQRTEGWPAGMAAEPYMEQGGDDSVIYH